MNKTALILIALAGTLGLQGCVSTGSSEQAPVRNIAEQRMDDAIRDTITLRQNDVTELSRSHINVDVFNGNVVLSGQVPSEASSTQAEKIARGVNGVRNLYNGLTVGENTPTWRRIQDSWLTTRIYNGIDGAPLAPRNRVHVVTEDGTVFMMGNVQRYEADGLANIAARVGGVKSVIKVFEYKG